MAELMIGGDRHVLSAEMPGVALDPSGGGWHGLRYFERRAKCSCPAPSIQALRRLRPSDSRHCRPEASPILMKRRAQHHPLAGRDGGYAVFDSLQSVRAADWQETVAAAEEDPVAEARVDLAAACLGPWRRITQQEFAALEAVRQLIGQRLIGARA